METNSTRTRNSRDRSYALSPGDLDHPTPLTVELRGGACLSAQVEENLRSLNVTLSAAHLERLEKASALEMGFPHDFLTSASVRGIVFAGLRDWINA